MVEMTAAIPNSSPKGQACASLDCMGPFIFRGGLCHLLTGWSSWTSPSHLNSSCVLILKKWEAWYRLHMAASQTSRPRLAQGWPMGQLTRHEPAF